MLEYVYDTETTTDDKDKGEIIEIGIVEINNLMRTGRTFHRYIQPNTEITEDAYKIHGIKTEDLVSYPKFPEIAPDILNFIGDTAPIVAHNAEFDINFVNNELKRAGFSPLSKKRSVDTLELARYAYPGQRLNLDALCKKIGINLQERGYHSALSDAEILTDIYIELRAGRQRTFLDTNSNQINEFEPTFPSQNNVNSKRKPHYKKPDHDEIENHTIFLNRRLPENIWQRYLDSTGS